MTKKIAYFDCFSGISGDMTIAAFLDAGLSFAKLTKKLRALNIKGYKLKKVAAKRQGITGTSFQCIVSKDAPYRRVTDILAIIDKSSLSRRVKSIASAIFENIARAEARIHGIRRPGDVHLHELGDLDSIVDIVGCAIAIEELGIDSVYSSAINLGRTFVNSRHGVLPIPSPASLELLKGIPVSVSEIGSELVTPTGAGILKTLVKRFGSLPNMKIESIGYGAGSKTIAERPNMLRVMIGETETVSKEERVSVIETNIDDMSPQGFEYIFEKLFEAGALDVYITTIQMKKSRVGFKLTALAARDSVERVSSVIFRETTSIGVRFYEAGRITLDRKIVRVKTKYGEIGVKLSGAKGDIFTASPEYDECVRIARSRKVPLKTVYEEARKTIKI